MADAAVRARLCLLVDWCPSESNEQVCRSRPLRRGPRKPVLIEGRWWMHGMVVRCFDWCCICMVCRVCKRGKRGKRARCRRPAERMRVSEGRHTHQHQQDSRAGRRRPWWWSRAFGSGPHLLYQSMQSIDRCIDEIDALLDLIDVAIGRPASAGQTRPNEPAGCRSSSGPSFTDSATVYPRRGGTHNWVRCCSVLPLPRCTGRGPKTHA